MTTLKQIEANRRNAQSSTGPRTEEGKDQSRGNAVRHGLTAETVIGVLEDPEDYKAFELAVASDFDAQTAVERELVLRLASLLWRLRRALAIETGLLQSQSDVAGQIPAASKSSPSHPVAPKPFDASFFTSSQQVSGDHADLELAKRSNAPAARQSALTDRIARCFLQLGNVDYGAFERLSRYETALWRQATQILLMLDYLGRRPRRLLSPSKQPRAFLMPAWTK